MSADNINRIVREIEAKLAATPPPSMQRVPMPRIGKQVVVGYEDLPAAGPGEVQVGEGEGPRPITEFKEWDPSKLPDIRDIVAVQPMTGPPRPLPPALKKIWE